MRARLGVASGAFGVGAPSLMWALDKVGIQLPERAAMSVLLISAAAVLGSIGIGAQAGFVWLHGRLESRMWPVLTGVLGWGIVLVGFAWYVAEDRRLKIEPPLPPRAQLSLLLLYQSDRLNLYNKGRDDLYLWGDKLEGYPASFEKDARTIPADGFYYFLTEDLKRTMLGSVGPDGERLLSFETYLSDEGDHRYVAKFALLIKMKAGQMEIHTQQLGSVIEDWKALGSKSPTAQEAAQRVMLLERLRREYILSHDGISPALAAGTELPPQDWINGRLHELGQNWRIKIMDDKLNYETFPASIP